MEILLNLIGGIFKPDEEAAADEESLQAALSAQVRKSNYENRGMAVQDRRVPKKNPDARSSKQSIPDLSKLMQVVFDMSSIMGCMSKAMINASMSFEKSPNGPKPGEQFVNRERTSSRKQPRRRSQVKLDNDLLCRSMIRTRSLIPMTTPNPNMEVWGSWQSPRRGMLVPNQRTPMLVGITRHNTDMRWISDSDASVD